MRGMACCAAAVLVAATAANAAIIYAPNGLDRPTDGPDTLIVFDSADPASYTTIGSMDVDNIGFGGMEFDRDGNLWAYAAYYKSTGGAAGGLYSVDTNTGLATVQGTLSTQPLEDLAYNPVDDTMYGIRSQNNVTRLYTVDLITGETAAVGTFTGLPASQHAMSFAIDSEGSFYVHDLLVDKIYKGAGLELAELYDLPQNTNFSQGMTIDWSRADQGYHGAVGYGDYPHYFSQVNTFATDGSDYTLGPDFGEELPDGLPPVEPGDLAIMPATACPGDLDGDNDVDLSDLAQLLANYGTTSGAQYEDGDLDGDGDVDLSDLAALLAAYGVTCP